MHFTSNELKMTFFTHQVRYVRYIQHVYYIFGLKHYFQKKYNESKLHIKANKFANNEEITPKSFETCFKDCVKWISNEFESPKKISIAAQ